MSGDSFVLSTKKFKVLEAIVVCVSYALIGGLNAFSA